MTASPILSPVKFCNKCQCETERRKSGRCKPCAIAADEKWKSENPEKLALTQSNYRNNNLEKVKAAIAKWAKNNPDRKLANLRASRAANPESARLHRQNRRNRVCGTLSKDIVKKLLVLQRGKCACCSQPLGDDYHLDHIMPLALGGPNTDDNIQLLRQRCNNQKHSKHPIDFMQSRGFLL